LELPVDAMNTADEYHFYSSKPRLIHMAANIFIAPALLYLVGVWTWPPVLPHYITFFISGFIALGFVKQRWGSPRLVFDSEGLYFGEYYPAESIQKVEPVMRSLKLSLIKDGEIKDKIISLGWASNDDLNTIVKMAVDRFNRSESS
jgi:hypothetical protein